METKELKERSTKGYLKFFFFYGLFNTGISVMWGAYNNYVPVILQAGNPNFTVPAGTAIAGFGLSAVATGLIMSMDNLLGTFMGPIFGAMGDKSLRRKELGAALGILCAIFFALIPKIATVVTPETSGRTMLLLLPLVLMVTAAFMTILADAFGGRYRSGYLFNVVPKTHHNKMSSFSVTFGGIGYITAIAASSYLYMLDKAYPFYLGAAIELIVSIAFFFFVPAETEKNALVREELANSDRKFVNPLITIKEAFKTLPNTGKLSMLMILLVKNFAAFGVYGFQTYASSWMLVKVGLQPNIAMLATGVYFLGYMLTAIPIGIIADKANKSRLYSVSIIIMIICGAALLVFGTSFINICIIVIFVGLGMSIMDVITIPYILSFMPEKSNASGTVFSLTLSALTCFTVINVPLIGFIIDTTKNYDMLFVSMIVTSFIAIIPLVILNKLNKK